MTTRIFAEWTIFLCAYQFLTRLPVPTNFKFSQEALEESARYYTLVGSFIGAAAALLYFVLNLFLPEFVSVILITIFTIYLTGAFHEDGFADFCDGMGGGLDAEHVLEIMRDSRLGTYGTTGLLLLLLLKISLLFAISSDSLILMMTLVLSHGISRFSAVIVIIRSEYVRSSGAAKPVASGLSKEGIVITIVTAFLLIAIAVPVIPSTALLGAGAVLMAAHAFVRSIFEKRLGGYSGDCLGATQQVSETAIYLGIVLCI